jgi:hypothetical protein
MNDHEILAHDLAVLEAMVAYTEPYLISDVTQWDMGRPGMPSMTLGGILMRRQRLLLLRDLLDGDERARLAEANETFDRVVADRVVRLEQRANVELQARMREWTHYLRDLTSHVAARPEHYRHVADTRVVIGHLVDLLSEPPYRLDAHVPDDVAACDRRLKADWSPGEFIWSSVWEPAYPRETYWWLYGSPRPHVHPT